MTDIKYIGVIIFLASTPFLFIGMALGILYELFVYGFTTGTLVCDLFMKNPLYKLDEDGK